MESINKYHSLISFYLQTNNLDDFTEKWNNFNEQTVDNPSFKEKLSLVLKNDYNTKISNILDIEDLPDEKLRVLGPITSHNGEKIMYHIPIKNKEHYQLWMYDKESNSHQMLIEEGAVIDLTKSLWNDKDTKYFYNNDPNHDEKYQLFVYNVESNDIEQLTHDSDVNNLVDILNDDELLVYKNSAVDFQFYSFSLKDKSFRQISNIDGGIQTTAGIYIHYYDLLSKDKGKITFPHNNAIWMYDFKTNQSKEIYKIGDAILTPKQWHPNNREIYFESNHLDKKIIGSVDIYTNKVRWIGNTDYENSFGIVTEKYIFIKVFKDGSYKLVKYDYKGDFIEEMEIDGSVPGILLIEKNEIFFYSTSFTYEIKYFKYNLDTKELKSYFETYDQNPVATPKINFDYITIPSHETHVSTFILKPNDFDITRQYPTLVFIHGGPYSHYYNSFDYIVQKLLELDFIAVLPNPSGSTGYGRMFNRRITISEDQIQMGKKDIADIDTIIEHISTFPYIDKNALTIAGASYGGYLTWMYAVKGKYRQTIKKIIPMLSITSFEIFTDAKENQILRHILQAFILENLLPDVFNAKDENTVKRYQEMLREASPLTYIQNLSTDCFMIQSGTDQRTSRTHTDAVLSELKKLYGENLENLPFKMQYEILEGYGHNILSLDLLKKVALFLTT